MEGRRERKKRQTREVISQSAFRLFAERGFDAVTIADIADAADVAVNTVFNYFKTKEDLFFNAFTPPSDSLADRLRDRAPGESLVASLRRLLDEGYEQMANPTSWPAKAYHRGQLRSVLEASPALFAKAMTVFRQRRMDAMRDVAEAITSPEPPDALAYMVAGQLLSALDGSVMEAERIRRSEEPCLDVVGAIRPVSDRLCDMLERGIGDYGVR